MYYLIFSLALFLLVKFNILFNCFLAYRSSAIRDSLRIIKLFMKIKLFYFFRRRFCVKIFGRLEEVSNKT